MVRWDLVKWTAMGIQRVHVGSETLKGLLGDWFGTDYQ
jgi:hypothetical protein